MNLTPKLADKVAKRYDRDHNGFNDFRDELLAMVKRDGLAILDDDARRELIVTIGRNHRAQQARRLWISNGGDTSRPWKCAYGEWLTSQVRAATAPALADAAE